MGRWRLLASLGVHQAILGAAALLVPRRERREWRAEWASELWYLLNRVQNGVEPGIQQGATRFCLGAFRDAIWLRLHNPRPEGRLFSLRSPIQCLALLALSAAGGLLFAFRFPGVRDAIHQLPTFVHLLGLAAALLILPSTTTLDLGERPATRLRGWIFLAVKFALIVPAVFFGTIALGLLISRGGLQAHAAITGYVLAFRWALMDQRRRCPVCLRLLSNPVRIGQPSHVFLEWYGTELMCTKGHGLMHVPEMPTISCRIQRWLPLDGSWRSLFS